MAFDMGIKNNYIKSVILGNVALRKMLDLIYGNKYLIGRRNMLEIGKNVIFKHTSIQIFGQCNSIVIEDGCCFNYAVIQIFGSGGSICIGKNTRINGIASSKTRLCCGGGGKNSDGL